MTSTEVLHIPRVFALIVDAPKANKMYKFIVKLSAVVIGLYLLAQIPFIGEKFEAVKVSFYEKVGNVVTEYNRIRGKVDVAKEKVDETKETISDIKGKIDSTTEAVEDVLTSINKAKEVVDKITDGADTNDVFEEAEGGSEEQSTEETQESAQ